MNKSVIVIDQLDGSVDECNEIICWRSYEKGIKVTSIPGYLEEYADRLRSKYLSFIYELGKTVIDGKSIIGHTCVAGNFSLWWMSHLAEKSPFKSPRIYDCLRLLALEEILSERKPSKLHLISTDKFVTESISILCRKLKINFTYKKDNLHAISWSIYSLYHSLPYALQGLISLRHLLIRWPLRRLRKPEWFSGNNSIFMCSYFYHMDASAGNEGKFYSRQWEELPEYISKLGKNLNWIHHFLDSPGMPDIQGGVKWFEQFNRDAKKQGNHAFIESYLSYRTVFQVIKNWIRLNIIAWKLRGVKKAFIPKESYVDLWPLLKSDWKTSLIGPSAINNCLWFELFDSALKDMPYQEKGFYLWENQGWEAALVYAWKKNGHGRIIGVPHSTVRFWALNNFDDARTVNSKDYLSKPLPDNLAVNGQRAWDEFIKTSYPIDRLIKVEALRYQYLLSSNYSVLERKEKMMPSSDSRDEKIPMRILIIGDFAVKQTYKMLRCVELALGLTDTKTTITLKPHPACKVGKKDFPNLKFNITDRPLADIMSEYSMAFSSNTTSGGLDAVLAGMFVVIYLDDEDFNHSPLRGVESVKFVANPADFAEAMKNIENGGSSVKVSDFFWLDSQLTRWKNICFEKRTNLLAK